MHHRQNQRGTDATGTDQTQDGSIAQIDIESVQNSRSVTRSQLGQDSPTDRSHGRNPHDPACAVRLQMNIVDSDEEPLGQEAHTAQSQCQHTGKRPRTGNANPHQAIYKDGNSADEQQYQPGSQCCWCRKEPETSGKGKPGSNDRAP